MVSRDDIASLNKDFYLSKTAAAWYAEKGFVMPEEQAFLRDYESVLKGCTLLDMGIGAGRTTRFLLQLVGEYRGFDYSNEMVRAAAARFPGVKIEERDARDLSAYGDASFDVVLFSFNGIDCLSHQGRLQVMGEVKRVLKPGGIFAFSSHNREKPKTLPQDLSNLNRSKNPVRMVKNLIEYWQGIRNWKRSLHCAEETDSYELRHDSSNGFKAPIYYIRKSHQMAQAATQGFAVEAIYNGKGQPTTVDESDTASSWIFYACRKSA